MDDSEMVTWDHGKTRGGGDRNLLPRVERRVTCGGLCKTGPTPFPVLTASIFGSSC